MGKITVIVPIYGTEKFLSDCLDAICRQTHRDLEILLIDDGGPDRCGEICDAYAAADSRIRVIHQENRGLSAARNAGLDAMTGEFVAFIDSDDVPEPEMLETLLTLLTDTGAEAALCNIQKLPGGTTPMRDEILTREAFLQKLTEPEAWFYVTVMNKLCRREIWEDLRFPEGFLHEDEAVLHRLVARVERFAVTERALYGYRQHPGSIMGAGVNIRTTDKLAALSDRLVFSRRMGWRDLAEATACRYSHNFFDLYFRFHRNLETEIYFLRMERGLRRALPYLLTSGRVSFGHKWRLSLLALWPGLYRRLKNRKGGTA